MIDTRGMNIFPALPGGDPAHAVIMYAETSDIENVMIAGTWHRVGAGHVLRLPAKATHALKAVGRFKMLLVMVKE